MNADKTERIIQEAVKLWWDPYGPMMGLHTMNSLRITLIHNGLEYSGKIKSHNIESNPKYLNGIKIIDVGCGGGILCEPLAKLGAEVTGIDSSEDFVNIAKRHAVDSGTTLKPPPSYLVSTIEDHSSTHTSKYDALVASEVIENVPNKHQFLDACAKIVKPHGSMFLTTPNRTVASWLNNIFVNENIFKLLPKRSYDNFVTPLEMQRILNRAGCSTFLVNGMIFNTWKKSWLWSESTLLHYALHAIKNK